MRPYQLLDEIVLFCRKSQPEPGNDQATDINDAFHGDLEESFTRPLFFDLLVDRKAVRGNRPQVVHIAFKLIDLGENTLTVQHGRPPPGTSHKEV
jgi:hypothetical protein